MCSKIGRLLPEFLAPLKVALAAREVDSPGTDSFLEEVVVRREISMNFAFYLMGYNQARMREMGTIVANHGKRPLKEVTQDYGNALAQALKKPPRFTAMINVLLHAFGGFKDSLSPDEKRYFLGSVEEYRDEWIPLSALLRLIEAWAVGKGNPYLLEQTFMRPYPRELVEVADSGKGRDW